MLKWFCNEQIWIILAFVIFISQSCALYWPEEYGYTEEHGPLSVELLSSSDVDPDVTVRIFKLCHHGRVCHHAIFPQLSLLLCLFILFLLLV